MDIISMTAEAGIATDTPPQQEEGEELQLEEGEYKTDEDQEMENADMSYDYLPENGSDASSVYSGAESKHSNNVEREEAKEVSPPPVSSTSPTETMIALRRVQVEERVILSETIVVEKNSNVAAQTDNGRGTSLSTQVLALAGEQEVSPDQTAGCTPNSTESVDKVQDVMIPTGSEGREDGAENEVDDDMPPSEDPPADYDLHADDNGTSEPLEDESTEDTLNEGQTPSAASAVLAHGDDSDMEAGQDHAPPVAPTASKIVATGEDSDMDGGQTTTGPDPEYTTLQSTDDSNETEAASSPTKRVIRKAPTATPKKTGRGQKRPKTRTATTPTKRRKVSEADVDGSGGDSPHLRRSSRIKAEAPRYGAWDSHLPDASVMWHFDRRTSASGSDPASMECKYCHHEITASRKIAAAHLLGCPAFKCQDMQQSDGDTKTQGTMPGEAVATDPHSVKREASHAPDKAVRLLGSAELAGKLRGAFQRSVFVGHEPLTRFQALIKDDVDGLRHLKVQQLLNGVDPTDEPPAVLHVHRDGVRRTGQDQLKSVSVAKTRALERCALRFPAPRTLASQFIAPLAKELGLEYAMSEHSAKVVSCPESGSVLGWRFHKSEMVVFQLLGRSNWKTKAGPAAPQTCFHPESWQMDDVAQLALVLRAGTSSNSPLGWPFENVGVFDGFDSDQDDSVAVDTTEVHQVGLKPGSVLYLPGGTWFETETKSSNALWLEVQLASVSHTSLAMAALSQLMMSDSIGRRGLQLHSGNRADARSSRHDMKACLSSIGRKVSLLEENSLLPEYLVTEDLRELVAEGAVQDLSESTLSKRFEVDLRDSRFKLKHVKIFKGSSYRVNPVAVLLRADEIPFLDPDVEISRPTALTTHKALKRKPKPRRTQALHALTHHDEHVYVLEEVFGISEHRPQLHVKFTCSHDQAKMVEWLRIHRAQPFDVEEFTRGDDAALRLSKTATQSEEIGRNLLRFLCFVGYVSQVKPL